MSVLPDSYETLAAPSTGEYKDRNSKFIAYACPVPTEADALLQLDAVRKEHFKARHHCFAWRLGMDGARFRANDDGEPSGTAGRPILGQIDAFGLTDVLIVVTRYFGGTLLGTSGLIQAYRESAAEALRQGQIIEVIVQDHFTFDFDYALMPDVMQAVKKLGIPLLREMYAERACLEIGIRQSESTAKLLQMKALLWKCTTNEAVTLNWPAGMSVVAH